jgi:hypothetical protein
LSDLEQSEDTMRVEFAETTIVIEEVRLRERLLKESVAKLEAETSALRSKQGALDKLAADREREAATAQMTLESQNASHEASMKNYGEVVAELAVVKAKLEHKETEFEHKKTDYQTKLNMLEDALLEEKKLSRQMAEDMREEAIKIADLRDAKRKDEWERNTAVSERREAENEIERLKTINQARVQASQDSSLLTQQQRMREVDFTLRQSQAMLESEREANEDMQRMFSDQLEKAAEKLQLKELELEKQRLDSETEIQRQWEIAAMTASDGEAVAMKLAAFVQEAEAAEAEALHDYEQACSRLDEMEWRDELRGAAEPDRMIKVRQLFCKKEDRGPFPEELSKKYDWRTDAEEQATAERKRKLTVHEQISREVTQTNFAHLSRDRTTRGTLSPSSPTSPMSDSGPRDVSRAARLSAPEARVDEAGAESPRQGDDTPAIPRHRESRMGANGESSKRKSRAVFAEQPVSPRTDDGRADSSPGNSPGVSAPASPLSQTSGRKTLSPSAPTSPKERRSRVAGFVRGSVADPLADLESSRSDAEEAKLSRRSLASPVPAAPKLNVSYQRPPAEPRKSISKEDSGDLDMEDRFAPDDESDDATRRSSTQRDPEETGRPEGDANEELVVEFDEPAPAVESKNVEIQAEISESTVSVQTDLSFMLAALMSKKPGSQRAIEDFARQTLEEFGLGQAWASTQSKPDFQVAKPTLLATQPVAPPVPPTVLKTREDPRRANLLAQSKGFLQTSGPYFLRGKGSQRAPVVKGKALYDVVPS